jgi:hypothetical protein
MSRSTIWRCARNLVLIVPFALDTGQAIGESLTECPSSPALRLHPGQMHTASNALESPIWKTIELGRYKGANAIREAMYSAPCHIHVGDDADEILGRPAFPFNKAPAELDLVVLSVFDLGDKYKHDDVELVAGGQASLHDIYARAVALGFELCPAEVGPALRLNYLDQPIGEFLHIAMTPVARFSGELVDFTVGNGGAGLLLIGGKGDPDLMLPGAVRFVFVRPRPIVLR